MNRLKLYILIFFVTASVPLAFVVYRSYSGLNQEEQAQLRFFSETLFDQMEEELAGIVQLEELRAVDEYQHFLAGPAGRPQRSPLAAAPDSPFILGYLQNNPDGSFQTPLLPPDGERENLSVQIKEIVSQLREANGIFNGRKFSIIQSQSQPDAVEAEALADVLPVDQVKRADGFAERFLKRSKTEQASSYLGKKEQRVEEISAEQALNVASDSDGVIRDDALQGGASRSAPAPAAADSTRVDRYGENASRSVAPLLKELADMSWQETVSMVPGKFQVEVAPFQSVALDGDQLYMFRRVVINNQIYRQGFILLVEPLLQHLADVHFNDQPLAKFTMLTLQRRDQGTLRDVLRAGAVSDAGGLLIRRLFPEPFDFLSVSLTAGTLPASPARRSLTVALVVLGVVILLGLAAIYQSARTIVAMSERRSQFVSSVTHELKTPLTNIRMYIELLEQGIATTPEREQEYLAVLGYESARLSGLINNVLELAKLEKKKRHFHLQEGQLDEVMSEIESSMGRKLENDGFTLTIKKGEIPLFAYDREVLVQILVNLIENSLKFGRQSATRDITIRAEVTEYGVEISVSDTGPGIPPYALTRVFEEFYRVDNDLTRLTGGTGIGLALVKQFATALGGTVSASNNVGAGCTITLVLPV